MLRRSFLAGAAAAAASPQPLGDGDGPGRFAGIGWQLRSEGGRAIAENGGSVRGYNALVLTYPKERRGFVILTNAATRPAGRRPAPSTARSTRPRRWDSTRP